MSIAKKSAWDYGSQVAMMILSMAAGIMIARIFKAEGAGVFGSVVFATLLGTRFTNLGMRVANQYFVGKDPGVARSAHTLSILFAFASSAVALGAGWLFLQPLLSHIALRNENFDPKHWRLLGWVALTLPFSLYNFGWSGIMVGLGRVKQLAIFNVCCQLVESLVILSLLIAQKMLGQESLWVIVAAWACLWVVRGGAMVALLWDCRPRAKIDWPLFRQTLSYGARAFVGNFAGSIMQSANKLFVTIAYAGQGFQVFGTYYRADTYSTKFFLHGEALERGAFPSMARASRQDAARLACRLTRNSLFIGLCVWILGGAASSFLLFLNGPEFIEAIPWLWIMMPAPLAMGASRMLAMFYSANLGKPQIPSVLAWAGAAINIPLIYFGIVYFGPMGAALATSVSFTLHFGLYIIMFKRELNSIQYGLGDLLIIRRDDFDLYRKHATEAWRTFFPQDKGEK